MEGNAAVVTIEQLRSCEPSGRRQVDHRPAKANGSPSARVTHQGCLRPSTFYHS